jgi:hypothetical protein
MYQDLLVKMVNKSMVPALYGVWNRSHAGLRLTGPSSE